LLSGKIKDNFKENECFDMSDSYMPTTLRDEVHSLVCLVPYDIAKTKEYVRRFRKFYELVNSKYGTNLLIF